jgi:hypothetical protein
MTILNIVGFESAFNGAYDIDALSGDCQVQTTTKRSGGYGMEVFTSGGSTGYALIRSYESIGSGYGNGTSQSFNIATLYTEFYFRYATKPASGSELIFKAWEAVAPSQKFAIRLDSNGKLNIYNSANTQIGSAGSTTLNANTWYKIGVKVGTGGSAAYEVQIDDTTEFSGTDNLSSNNNEVIYLGVHTNTSSQTVSFFFDDVYLNDVGFTTGDFNVLAIRPVANGATMDWTSGTGSSDYQEVNEESASDGSYVQNSTTGDALFDMTSCATAGISGTIKAVKLSSRARENASGTSSLIQCYMKKGSNTINIGARNAATSVEYRTMISEVDPDGAAWTTSSLDATDMGARQGNTLACRLTHVFAQVLFIPPTSSIGTNQGLAYASIGTVQGLALASVGTMQGLV